MSASLPDNVQLGYAKQWLRANLDKGAPCPCCTQYAKVYRRKVNTGMARSLIEMYRIAGSDWVHVPTQIGARSREEGKLAYWSLVEESVDARDDGGRAGWWRLTPKGVAFVRGLTRIPKYALVYDGRVIDFGVEETVDIRAALGTRFSYDDLMAGI